MSQFENFSYITVGFAFMMVSVEMKALCHALEFASKQSKYSGTKRLLFTWRRYTWASVVFHGLFARQFGGNYAWKVTPSIALGAALTAISVYGRGLPLSEALGASIVVCLMHFFTVYGSTFFEWRAVIEEHQQQGTWQLSVRR